MNRQDELIRGKGLKKTFDPLAYIENAFLDKEPAEPVSGEEGREETSVESPTKAGSQTKRKKLRRTEMSAPRPRMASKQSGAVDQQIQDIWEVLPRNVEFLSKFFSDDVTANYYRGDFKENRQELIRRLLNPELTLEETSRLLGVCPATVRRYTNRGWLAHHRTVGGQRRFRLSNVIRFVEEHGRFPLE